MQIAIVGAGKVGTALGPRLAAAGHTVRYGVRDPARDAGRPEGPALVVAEAVRPAEVVLLATPWPAAQAACAAMGDLRGRIVVDCTNPLGMVDGGLGLTVGHARSGGELVAEWCPGAAVFKSFNQTGFEIMADPARFAPRPAMFVAGDDAARKPVVLCLVADVGFEALDGGPLANARLLEPYAMVWIDQVLKRGAGRDFAFALARPAGR